MIAIISNGVHYFVRIEMIDVTSPHLARLQAAKALAVAVRSKIDQRDLSTEGKERPF